ncbi:hypothetical protein LMH87_002261 [Akanthomyces muscarius]|uniref:Uncharacterized protein n=1 Tax=Akanthomyces muscarius TaxID=2231603 RepID=A0A9W8Q7Z7_AKAMU|nr:hypothetical protein LMH87_002261 [Akanthomyces muscarius]KAJ4147755.1 hypothetical protein LMH87_002261 [Akanthomyces muscarius]
MNSWPVGALRGIATIAVHNTGSALTPHVGGNDVPTRVDLLGFKHLPCSWPSCKRHAAIAAATQALRCATFGILSSDLIRAERCRNKPIGQPPGSICRNCTRIIPRS